MSKERTDFKEFDGKKVHLIGIGGIGMSAVAEVLHYHGIDVQGSDLNETYITSYLKKLGIKVIIGHYPENLKDVNIVIRSTAIKDHHIEIIEAKRLYLTILHRAEALAKLLKNFKTVAVTGTHGKSTTTALTGAVCVAAGLNPTIVNGAFINQFASNVRIGNRKLAVIESDESDESFLVLPSDLAIVTNMDPDHLDYYGSISRMEQSYRYFILKSIKSGICFICNDHIELSKLGKEIGSNNVFTYAINVDADIKANNIQMTEHGTNFDVIFSDNFKTRFGLKSSQENNIFLSLYGLHNVSNAVAAIAVSLTLCADMTKIKEGLKTFAGIKRRFTKVGEFNGAVVIDDYAHHPAEIGVTLDTAKHIAKIKGGKVIAVMQPHRYTRLAALMEEFAASLSRADKIILTPVYGAGENMIPESNSINLRNKIINHDKKVLDICQRYEDLISVLMQHTSAQDIIVVMGAGDITNWTYKLVEKH